MSLEDRPTSVFVMGWLWMVLGGFLSVFSGLILFLSLFLTDQVVRQEDSAYFNVFCVLALVQCCIGLLALVSGSFFLKGKTWSLIVLEILTWLFIVYVLGVTGFMFFALKADLVPSPPAIKIMILVGSAMFLIPLGIMLTYLRRSSVRTYFGRSTNGNSKEF